MKEARNSFVDSITRKAPFSFGKNKESSNVSKKEAPKVSKKADQSKSVVYKKEDKKKFKFL